MIALQEADLNEKALETELTYQGLMTLLPGMPVYAIDGPFFYLALWKISSSIGAKLRRSAHSGHLIESGTIRGYYRTSENHLHGEPAIIAGVE